VNRIDLTANYPGFTLRAQAEWDAPCTALFGASGAGKTTILEALCGLRREVTGAIVLADQRVDLLPAHERALGWVPQDAALFPHMSTRENIEFSLRFRGSAQAAREAIVALELENLLERRAADLSGGERQRVAIARALASAPRFLLLDEPLASLDRPLRARILPFLEQLYETTGVPVLLVTHDPLEVLALARHALVVEAGRVVTQGDPRSVFAAAATFGGLQALGAENRFDVSSVEAHGGTLHIQTAGGCRLSMVRVEGFPAPGRIAVRAEDILLAVDDPGAVSAQNVIAATVTRVEPIGEQVYVHLDGAGEHWRAKVTERAVRELALAPEKPLRMLIKAHAILPLG